MYFPPVPPPEAQVASAPPALLDRITENVVRLGSRLPSITADEAITSDFLRIGLYRAKATATATVRISASANGLREDRKYLTENGKPVSEGKHVQLPFTLSNAFSNFTSLYFGTVARSCLVYSIVPGTRSDGSVEILFRTPDAPLPACKLRSGIDFGLQFFGKALVDPDTAEVRHLERTLTRPPEHNDKFLNYAEVDLAPARIGEETFWLPTHLKCEYHFGEGHWEAAFSNYHRYAGAMTIVPDSMTPVAGDKP